MLSPQCLFRLLNRVPKDLRCLLCPVGKSPAQASKSWIVSFGPTSPPMHLDSPVWPSDYSGSPHPLRILFNKVLIFIVVLETFHPLSSPLTSGSQKVVRSCLVPTGLSSQPAWAERTGFSPESSELPWPPGGREKAAAGSPCQWLIPYPHTLVPSQLWSSGPHRSSVGGFRWFRSALT